MNTLDQIIMAIDKKGDALRAISGVFGVRPGFRTSPEGERSEDPAIIVVTTPGETVGAVPAEVDGIPVETRAATAWELMNGLLPLSAWEGIAPEAAPQIGYVPPDPSEVALEERCVHNITCHIGPDSGWATLQPFLEGAATSLTVAMYEFYADYIVDSMTHLGEDTQATLDMILQVSANDKDIEEKLNQSWGDRLKFVPACVSGPNRIFNNAYHIKVAVRDSSAFWLSSGNWSPSSQPLIQPGSEQILYNKGNREWHVIIDDASMAQMFEKFIRYDMREARAAEVPGGEGEPEAEPVQPDLLIPEAVLEPEAAIVQDHPFAAQTFAVSEDPVRVKPLLSPDNYAKTILDLIQNAESSLYLQYAYIRQPSNGLYDDIINCIAQKMNDNLDVRVLVGPNQAPEHSEILIGKRGWKRSMFRRQKSKVHNKGILVDGKIAVVGSNNWSTDGTQYNRDASLIFYSEPIARYFTEVFLFDWDNLSKSISSAPEISPLLAPEGGPTPPGMVRIPWRSWFDE